MEFKIKFTKKVIGAIILFSLGFILLIGYPRQKATENQSGAVTKIKQETVIKKNKTVSNSIEKYKTPKKKRVIRTVQQPVSNNYQDEGC